MSKIKFLKGYGLSISHSNNQIKITNGIDPFSDERQIESYHVTAFPYEKIVLSDDGYISTKAIRLLLQNNISIIQLDTFGNLVTSMCTPMQSQKMTKWRMGQYRTFSDESKAHRLRQRFLDKKIRSEVRFFEYLQSDSRKSFKLDEVDLNQSVLRLKSLLFKIPKGETKFQTDMIEKDASKIYFKQFAKIIPERFEYSSRNNESFHPTKENATNVINALLNYGYAVLSSEVAKYVNAFGLDPYFGFNHKTSYYMALVYDIIEPFRVLADQAVIQISNAKSMDRISKKQYYRHSKGILFEKNLIVRFLEILQNTLNRKRPYHITRARKSYKLGNKMSFAQESTIMKEEVRTLANFCIT